MDQEKIGKFIAENRKKQNLTQEVLAEKLGITKNAVSKWERGLCLMDMSLLKPLSEILDVNVVDILSGEIVKEESKDIKYEESIENIIKLNDIKANSFSINGLLLSYFILMVYKHFNNIRCDDIISLFFMVLSFKYYYYYKVDKSKNNLIISLICLIVSILMFIIYINNTI